MLRYRWTLRTHRIALGGCSVPAINGDTQAVVVALLHPENEPMTILRNANLLGLAKRVPVILISLTVEQEEAWAQCGIRHVDFPLEWHRLSRLVAEAIQCGGPKDQAN